MKKSKKVNRYLFGILVLVFGSSWASAAPEPFRVYKTETEYSATNEKELVGYWSYTVANAPVEYSKGDMLISKTNDAYAVKIILPAGSISAESVVVKGNQISFKLYVEGSLVSVSLTAKSGSMSGAANTPEGTMQISGQRVIKP